MGQYFVFNPLGDQKELDGSFLKLMENQEEC